MKQKIAYFKNGILHNIYPRSESNSLYEDRGVAYDSDTVIISDSCIYDPADPKSIIDLKIPKFGRYCDDVVFDLSYILKIRCESINDPALIPVFVRKTLELMEASPVGWRRRDYLRVICTFYENGLFRDGDCFEARYRASHKNLFSSPFDDLHEAEHLSTKYYFEEKWRKYNEYDRIKTMLPDLVPDTVRGYLQIRTRQTKRFLQIKEEAERQGFVFYFEKKCHYCRKYDEYIPYFEEYDHTEKYSVLKSVLCDKYLKNRCLGTDEFGLSCVFPKR